MGKQKLIATMIVAFLASITFAANVIDKRPVGPAPRSVVIEKVEPAKAQVSYLETITKLMLEERTAVRTIDGRQVAYKYTATVPVQESKLTTIFLRPGKVYSLDGNKLEEKEIWTRVKKGTTILISTDGKPVDAVHLKKANPDTIVLVPVKNESIPVAKPEPRHEGP